MNLRFYIICTAALLTLVASVSLTLGVPFLEDKNITATVHGATYVWNTLEPLNDTVIDINSIPPQSMVAKNGMYSFELVPGDYTITARYYQNNTLIYSKEATFKIEDEGNYVLDLLLYPVSEYPVTETILDEINHNSVNPPEQTSAGSSVISYLPIALALLLLFGGGYILFSMRKKEKNTFQKGKFNIPGLLEKISGKNNGSGVIPKFGNLEEAVSVTEPVKQADNSKIEAAALKKLPLSTELQRVMDVIRSHKGQITQKDLRSRLEYSEVKVSLILSELEKRELIKKFKNGRENIVVLRDEGR